MIEKSSTAGELFSGDRFYVPGYESTDVHGVGDLEPVDGEYIKVYCAGTAHGRHEFLLKHEQRVTVVNAR